MPSDLSEKISNFMGFFESGSESSAAATFAEILHDFLEDLYPMSSPRKREPKFLVHYTSLDTLFSLLDRDKPEYLRLYDTIHSNDPTEGAFFSDHLKSHALNIHRSLPDFIQNPQPGYAYISSFIRAYDETKRDKLKYWLAYGRNGNGCSIAIPYSDFSPELPIVPVQYGKAAVMRSAQKLVSFLHSFPPSVQHYFSPSKSSTDSSSPFNTFSSIPYFHKPRSYSYEAECRLFLSPIDRLSDPKYQPIVTTAGTPAVRHYVEHKPLHLGRIFFTGTVITLGPSIPNPQNVQRAVYALLRHHRLMGPDVVCSKIPYRPASR